MLDEIFRAYDIRGTYPDQFNEDIAYRIGRAVAELYKPGEIVIARDMRLSSPLLANSLIKGLTDSGIDVIDAGLCSTPLFYFIMGKFKYDLGVMITASHNPPAYNGMKFMKKPSIFINYETGLDKVKELVKKNEFREAEKKGKIIKKDFIQDYTTHVLSFAKDIPKKKIVIDAGNGMISNSCRKIFKKLPLEIIKLNFNLDGSFPNHESNPLVPGVQDQLKEAVKKNKADFGIIFDGDADRIFFVDENADEILGSIIGALISENFVKDKKESIIIDAVSSRIIQDTVGDKGEVIRSRVGYSYMSKAARKHNAVFGAEVSNHYSYRDNFYCDSGIITLLKVLEIIGDKKLSEALKPYKKYFNSGEINFEAEDKEGIMKKVEEHFKDAKISHLDGLTVEYDEWWCVVRPSNTEPLLRLRIEANSEELMKEKVEEVRGLIE
ncbi:MAG: phosphomannomutase/phosphoglucomutase [Nanoarchaeota archaeon]|nr:phosphomannomutase/phosphoglucomutase [Nanoarchaeota archaeon]